MKIFTEKDLAQLGYVETSPGVFTKSSSTPSKKLPPKTKNENSYAKHAGHYLINGKDIYFRSGWEYIYAQYLQFLQEKGQIKSWEFEPQTFWFTDHIKRGNVSYKPDFRITELDGSQWWAEVKGYMDAGSATKLKRMAKYYPSEVIKIVDREQIKQLKRQGFRL